jgi:hypothetical protein
MHPNIVPIGKRPGESSERKGMDIKYLDGYTMSQCVQGMTAFVKDHEHKVQLEKQAEQKKSGSNHGRKGF